MGGRPPLKPAERRNFGERIELPFDGIEQFDDFGRIGRDIVPAAAHGNPLSWFCLKFDPLRRYHAADLTNGGKR
jgi:hypothetical protein